MSDESLLDFSRAASDALRSALPLAEFLRGRGLAKSADAVSRGEALHSSLPASFPPLFVAMVRAGEESGKLDAFLDRYSASLETRIDFRRRLSRVLAYPIFAVALAVGLLLLFIAKGAPLLLLPLSSAGVVLPPGVLKLLGAGDWVRENWGVLAGGVAGTFLILREMIRSGPGRRLFAVAGRIVPGLRYVTEEARACEFEATLGLLLGAGLRPREAFEVLQQVVDEDPLLRRSLAKGAALLPSGAGFGDCVAPSLPADDRARFLTAEKAGRLDETLAKLAESHRERHLHRLKAASQALQIASIVALAPLVFGLAMSVVWPALAAAKAAAEQATSSGAPAGGLDMPVRVETGAKATDMDVKTSRFNEANAGRITAYMAEHEAKDSPPSEAKNPFASAAAEAPGKPADERKKVRKIPIRERSIQSMPRRTVTPTEIRSHVE